MTPYIIIFIAFILLFYIIDYIRIATRARKLFKLLFQINRILFRSGLDNERQEKIAKRFYIKILLYSLHLGLTIIALIIGFVLIVKGTGLLFYKNSILYDLLISAKGVMISLCAYLGYVILKRKL